VARGRNRATGRGIAPVNYDHKQNSDEVNTLQKLTRLLAAPVVEPSQRAARIQTVERDIVLPLRVLIIAILGYYFYFSGWFNTPVSESAQLTNAIVFGQRADIGRSHPAGVSPATNIPANAVVPTPGQGALSSNQLATTQDTTVTTTPRPRITRPIGMDFVNSDWSLHHAGVLKASFLAYALLNLALGAVLIWARPLTLTKIQGMVFTAGLLDSIVMATLTFLYNGFDSTLYLVFVALILHTALAIPVAFPQLLLNFLTIGSFVGAGILDARINIRSEADNISHENPYERVAVLAAWALCCYGIQVLFEKQKRAEAEATEFAVRQERLRTAGRLAAEIAHQIKNPLGIITNAAFSLQRAVSEGEMAVDEQIEIIREEVERADQIITELMGYAQLAEGNVERLDVSEEMDNAVQEVFPLAAKYKVRIHKSYEPALPALLMQKRHLSGVLVNLLQNAREAMNGRGEIEIAAKYGENDSIRIIISDSGPGIAPDKIDKIFEAYFTTREKGTGLGLAIVKHNTEMYGGTVDVKSAPGKGTQFALEFPSRILMRLSK
jgi:signal transduction histidine kinase